ncbi:MAG: inositol-3-phosphate synthase [Promethearchaeota archaeon]
MSKIRIAIAGIGNCASSFIQGLEYYKNVTGNEEHLPGLMFSSFGGYLPRDIEFVAAFDVSKQKIGKDLSEAIFAHRNCTEKISDVPRTGVEVSAGPILDGVAPHMRKTFDVYDEGSLGFSDVSEVLRKSKAEMLINFLPVGSKNASIFYAEEAIKAGCGFINAIPEFITSDPKWAKRFEDSSLPIAGDDIKSQLGATILHRAIMKLFVDRGVRVDETYQLNIGGNTDFENMTVEERLKTKRVSKTKAVTSLAPYEVPTRIGPSDYIPFLGDKKICYIWVKGRGWGNLPITVDVKLAVEDSPDSAAVIIDVVRAMKLALDRGIKGPLTSISAYSFKHPPEFVPDPIARKWVEEFIQGKRER